MAASDRAQLRRRIFAGCKALGLGEEARRDLQIGATGVESLSDMTIAQMQLVEGSLRQKGWSPKAGAAGRRPSARRADQRFIFVLWKLLAEAGVVKSGDKALRAFISSEKFAGKWGAVVADPNHLSAERAYDVIEALKAVAFRNGVDVERRR